MRRARVLLMVTSMVACARSEAGPAVGICAPLPQVEGACLGIGYDSLKVLRPRAFRDSDGVRELVNDSTQAVYYFSGTTGTLVAAWVEVRWREGPQASLVELVPQPVAIGGTSSSGTLRYLDPWVRDSLDSPATRWTGPGMELVARWGGLGTERGGRRLNVWAFAPGHEPPGIGRWID